MNRFGAHLPNNYQQEIAILECRIDVVENLLKIHCGFRLHVKEIRLIRRILGDQCKSPKISSKLKASE